ncbi:MAG: hypothetical protein NTW07_03755 [candidate division Zixibacteria bacterium]|nr:hypothetical protein [candidate division Zixibacteria bacterium]
MANRLLLIIVSLELLVSVGTYSQGSNPQLPPREVTIGLLPAVEWIFYIDASSGYVGTISENRKLFQLHDENGSMSFSRKAEGEDDIFYILVAMRDNPGFVLLTERAGEHAFRSIAFDYAGNVRLGPVTCENIVSLSPGGSYFYSFNDVGNDRASPCIYSGDGSLLEEFPHGGSSWDIKPVSDSLFLYRDKDHIQLISFPQMSVRTEISVDEEIATDLPASSLSSNGEWYAYTRYADVVVLNLREHTLYRIPIDSIGDYHPRFGLAISDSGLLVAYRQSSGGNEVIVYQRNGESYVRSAYNPDVTGGLSLEPLPVISAMFVDDSICTINLFAKKERNVTFSSYSFDAGVTGEPLQGQLANGLITSERLSGQQGRSFRRTRIDRGRVLSQIVQSWKIDQHE